MCEYRHPRPVENARKRLKLRHLANMSYPYQDKLREQRVLTCPSFLFSKIAYSVVESVILIRTQDIRIHGVRHTYLIRWKLKVVNV